MTKDSWLNKSSSCGINASKHKDFAEWYTQCIIKSEIVDYFDISGCYILRPWGYAIWTYIQTYIQENLTLMGVKNAYFPLLITDTALKREQEHVEGFAPEVAWVTHAGSTPLNIKLAIRPTSETAIYPSYSRWIKSHRDLPLRLNQWCNVVRWEFKNPQPLIRSREFLWQEGHSAFKNKAEADAEVIDILSLYKRVYEDLLAVPVITGTKSTNEKFAGADYTTTVEAFIPEVGRSIQAATSHSLGQNFSKIFDIKFEDENGRLEYVWQNSWGFTTRSLGIAIMTHGDDKGVILPPQVAVTQVIVMPVGINSQTNCQVIEKIRLECTFVVNLLQKHHIRAEVDFADNQTAGWKFNQWELKGVPLRIEIGPNELLGSTYSVVSRLDGSRFVFPKDGIVGEIETQLGHTHNRLFSTAYDRYRSSILECDTWESFMNAIDDRKIAKIPWCEEIECEISIKKRTSIEGQESIKSLCIPFDQANYHSYRCVVCGRNATRYAMFGRSF